jgi:FMNH2-dependent dimethyl sulfone monooxygenase
MKFGLWTPLPHTIRSEAAMEQALDQLAASHADGRSDQAFDFAVDVVTKAEKYGFHTTLIAERFLGPDLEAWTLAAALAARTSKIEVMVAVHPGMITPQVVAKMGASLDRLSGGRFAMNIVNGHWAEEFDLFSNGGWLTDPAARYRRMREFIQVIKGLWSDGALSFDGEFYRVNLPNALEDKNKKVLVPTVGDIQIKSYAAALPPIYAASRSATGKEIIAEHCNFWFAEYKPGYRNFEANLKQMAEDIAEMNAVCERFGRKVRYGLNPQVICEDTMEAAHAIADAVENPRNKDRISNALGAGLVGTPRLIAERIDLLGQIGIDVLMLRFSPMLAGLETFATKVIPLVKTHQP